MVSVSVRKDWDVACREQAGTDWDEENVDTDENV